MKHSVTQRVLTAENCVTMKFHEMHRGKFITRFPMFELRSE